MAQSQVKKYIVRSKIVSTRVAYGYTDEVDRRHIRATDITVPSFTWICEHIRRTRTNNHVAQEAQGTLAQNGSVAWNGSAFWNKRTLWKAAQSTYESPSSSSQLRGAATELLISDRLLIVW